MIEIKQEDDTLWLINNDYVYTSGMPVKRDELPHLISRLIELGGVEVDPSTLLCDEDSRSMIQLIQNNYHLIPKADKK